MEIDASEARKALLEECRGSFLHINEYWNGGNNSAVDACQFARAESERMLKLIEERIGPTVADLIREDCAKQCERRADSLIDGSAVARQCARDIRSRIKKELAK